MSKRPVEGIVVFILNADLRSLTDEQLDFYAGVTDNAAWSDLSGDPEYADMVETADDKISAEIDRREMRTAWNTDPERSPVYAD